LRSARRALFTAACLAGGLFGQPGLTWQEVRDRFEASNPTLEAARIGVDETRAQEITAHLRPNPLVSATLDQIDPFTPGPYRPLANSLPFLSASYLHETNHKRELRLASAQGGTAVAQSEADDERRTLLFNLRNTFNQALQAKAIVAVAQESLEYYDRLLELNRQRFQAGDIAQVDLDRLELQRVQFVSDLRTAEVDARTAKIQLLAMMNDHTPVDQFDITGRFDFAEQILIPDELRETALASRPDLRAAAQSVSKARTDYRLAVANGTSDITFSADVARNPPIPAYMGFSVNMPLRIFDRNQGEKARTELDIRRTERLEEAARTQALSDVDSALAQINSTLALLRPYKAKYLDLAVKVRDTISFSYQHGGASLLDFLNAQNEYRAVQVNYLNLVGAWMTAANQLNLAVGREVVP
jgi:cobalt-zinc-cadmium efflux system outer membrane protein